MLHCIFKQELFQVDVKMQIGNNSFYIDIMPLMGFDWGNYVY